MDDSWEDLGNPVTAQATQATTSGKSGNDDPLLSDTVQPEGVVPHHCLSLLWLPSAEEKRLAMYMAGERAWDLHQERERAERERKAREEEALQEAARHTNICCAQYSLRADLRELNWWLWKLQRIVALRPYNLDYRRTGQHPAIREADERFMQVRDSATVAQLMDMVDEMQQRSLPLPPQSRMEWNGAAHYHSELSRELQQLHPLLRKRLGAGIPVSDVGQEVGRMIADRNRSLLMIGGAVAGRK